jgi:hypothetical protein
MIDGENVAGWLTTAPLRRSQTVHNRRVARRAALFDQAAHDPIAQRQIVLLVKASTGRDLWRPVPDVVVDTLSCQPTAVGDDVPTPFDASLAGGELGFF